MPAFSYLSPALARLHPSWQASLGDVALQAQLLQIDQALSEQVAQGKVLYPPAELTFNALSFVAPAEVKVVVLGQDPYHGAGQGMGLSFSVPPAVRIPPSLRNIYKELAADMALPIPATGDLSHWAQQGVLLLNSVLTVEQEKAGSHAKLGWQFVSDALIDAVNKLSPACVFLLWGNWAHSKAERIDAQRHLVLKAAHPSPLSANRGFHGCRHFSQANAWLVQQGLAPIQWGSVS